ncbi:MAG TPA: EamA family transporter RarD [Thermoanaerobacterales bacterium]|nr:EamA family transporter RarD [Thermoanaerobacterales bacterium]
MSNDKMVGALTAVLASAIWGVLPIYWKLLANIPPVQILAHRILWSFIFALLLSVIFGRWDDVKKVFYDKRDLKLIFYASFIITLNWGLYIWAVNSNHILQTSMGYYINPLSSVLLGMIVFKEKLNVLQKAAIALAVAGVSILIFQYGRIPWVALGLAGTFSIYGVIKKLVKMDPMVGIVFEAGFTTPFAIMYLLYKQNNGLGIFGNVSTSIFLLVMASGIITALPLILLADAAKKIPFSTLGLTQYVSPSLSLLIGVFIYGEDFTTAHLTCFCFIWCGLFLYTLSQTDLARKRSCKRKANVTRHS